MIASTILMTLVGWGVTHWLIEPRFTTAQVQEQIQFALQNDGAAASDGNNQLTRIEKRGLIAASVALLLAGGIVIALTTIPGAALHGTITDERGHTSKVWIKAIVPIIFFCFLIPGLGYGLATGSIRSDRDVAKMMSSTMSTMGTYIIMAFFAAQFVAWFNESKLGHLIALRGVVWLQSYPIPRSLILVALIFFTAFLNLFIGSASAKWALVSTVFVPVLAGIGISPELTQAAYRVGDSATNSIAPLNPYIVIILMYLQRLQPHAGIGTLISAMLPYAIVMLIVWTALLLLWTMLGLPLGPDNAPLFLPV
jgi:aminobenzoyl-glutamate transport protein